MRYTMLNVPVEEVATDIGFDEEPCEPTRKLTQSELDEILSETRDE